MSRSVRQGASYLAPSQQPRGQVRAVNPLGLRAVLLGAAGVAVLAAANPYLTFVTRVWSVGSGSLLSGAVVVLFLLVLLNGALVRLSPGRAFTRSELLAAYGMMIISVGLAMQGGIPYLVGATTYPFYMASPENDWQHLIWPHIPLWLRLANLPANAWYWEGLPRGAAIPWAAWVTPMAAWFAFTLALMAAMFCLAALLSKDWIERQRLTFPLVEVPLAITGPEARPTLGKSLLSNRIFWIGFALPATCSVLTWLHALLPNVPAPHVGIIDLGRSFAGMELPWSVLSGMAASILFPVIGISCLLPGEVSLSLWLFYVLYRVQLVVWAQFGVVGGGQTGNAVDPQSFIGFQEAGGYAALSAALLYQSRKAIKSAAITLLGRGAGEPDPHGPLAGRWALLGFLVGNSFMLWWAMKAGMSWWSFTALIAAFYALLIGASRLVAAGGVMFVDTAVFPRGVLLRTVGAPALGAPSLTICTLLSLVYMYDPMNLAMPQMMNSFKLLHTGHLRGKSWPWAAALSVAIMLVVGVAALVVVMHHHGGANGTWLYDYPQSAFGELEATFDSPETPVNALRLALVIGGAFTLVLVWLNTSFVWWPLSPIGFIMASSWNANYLMWSNVFVAWAFTALVRRYGGLRLYRQMRPAFFGLVLGDYLTRGGLAVLSAALGVQATVSYGW
jgi:hypothetical protein